ncbi:MAG TPA: hypothetical protein VN703_03030, partial [Candidatus Sulfopaludibacter sp.]|nr:hypothetical protein [Candidatus Sulfopaludibacter sp.]
ISNELNEMYLIMQEILSLELLSYIKCEKGLGNDDRYFVNARFLDPIKPISIRFLIDTGACITI